MPLLSSICPSAAEGRPPQTPSAGTQAGHRRRQTDRRPAAVRPVSFHPSTRRWKDTPDLLPFLSPPRYLLYWRRRFLEQPVTEFCSVIRTNSTGPVGASADHLMRAFPAAAADTRAMASSQSLCVSFPQRSRKTTSCCVTSCPKTSSSGRRCKRSDWSGSDTSKQNTVKEAFKHARRRLVADQADEYGTGHMFVFAVAGSETM